MGKKKREEGVLVETGTFTVDRRRALEKMRLYQLKAPELFLTRLVRAGVAAGAARIQIDSHPQGVHVRFGGKVFRSGVIDDPFDAVFSEPSRETAAARELGIAVLGFLRLMNATVSIASGGGTRLRRSVVDGKLEPWVAGSLGRPPRTWWHTDVVCATPATTLGWRAKAYARLRERLGMADAYVSIDGQRVRDGFVKMDRIKPDFYSVLKRPANPDLAASRLAVHHFGILVGMAEEETSWAQGEGAVRFDGLVLDASGEKIVEGAARRHFQERVGKAVRNLVVREANGQNANAARIAKALSDPGQRRRWRRSIGAVDRAVMHIFTVMGLSAFENTAGCDRFREDLARTVWLRGACAGRLRKYQPEKTVETARALWRTKIFWAADGTPLSVLDIKRFQNAGEGTITAAKTRGRYYSRREVVWVPAKHDLDALISIFGAGAIVNKPEY